MKFKHIYIFALLPFILSNCETVLEGFNVNDSNPQVVIEASLNNNGDSAYVYISKTANYMNPVEYPKVSGASVSLSFDDKTIIIPEYKDGFYKVNNEFLAGKDYTIDVTVEGENYKATSFLEQAVPIDSIKVRAHPYAMYNPANKGKEKLEVTLFITDPEEIKNNYRLKVTKNDTLQNGANDILIFDDYYQNGEVIEIALTSYELEPNDIMYFELISIDEANVLYYNTLKEAMSATGNFSVPDNPKTNFSPYVLGHFEAFSLSDTTIILKSLLNY